MSLFLNWIVGPFVCVMFCLWNRVTISNLWNQVMLAIAWATLPDLPTYREGIILVGLARCIAMVCLNGSTVHVRVI